MPKINQIGGADALSRFKGHNLADTVKDAANIGNIPNVGGIQALLCGLAFAAGRAAKAKKIAEYSFANEYDAFADAYYSWPGRTKPSPNSRTQYLKSYGAFVKAGMAAWDGAPVVVAAIDMRDVTLSWRAGKVAELAKADKAPTAAEIRKAFTPKADQGGGNKGRTIDGRLKAIINSVDKLATDKRFMKQLSEAGSVKLEAMRTVFDGTQALREFFIGAASDKAKPKVQKAQAKFVLAVKTLPPRPRAARD